MVVMGCGTGGEQVLGGNFYSQKLEMFPLVAQQPALLW
jgi:hypothetical protein